jgi:outer membrane immunogenic protein
MRHAIAVLLAGIGWSVASAGTVSAADMPTKAPPITPAAMSAYNWTGLYVGGEVGGGWTFWQATIPAGSPGFPTGFLENPIHTSGGLGGAYGGYNYQINSVVLGIDGNYSGGNLRGSAIAVSIPGTSDDVHQTVNWIAAVTGRLGHAVNNWMFFGKAGWAWANFRGLGLVTNGVGVVTSNNAVLTVRDGWTGVEWVLPPTCRPRWNTIT